MTEHYSMFTSADRPEMDRLRRKARRLGLRLEKSRQSYHANNLGGFQLVHASSNLVLGGANYELGLADADYWIERYQVA